MVKLGWGLGCIQGDSQHLGKLRTLNAEPRLGGFLSGQGPAVNGPCSGGGASVQGWTGGVAIQSCPGWPAEGTASTWEGPTEQEPNHSIWAVKECGKDSADLLVC